jgi:hypothetical protein
MQHNFFPHFATSLLMKLAQKMFIECFSVLRALPKLLKEEAGLGAHTSIVVLAPTFRLNYFWMHDGIRPYGAEIALQCPSCAVIQQLEV